MDPAAESFGWDLPAAAGVTAAASLAAEQLGKTKDERSIERHQRKMRALERVIETPGIGLR